MFLLHNNSKVISKYKVKVKGTPDDRWGQTKEPYQKTPKKKRHIMQIFDQIDNWQLLDEPDYDPKI